MQNQKKMSIDESLYKKITFIGLENDYNEMISQSFKNHLFTPEMKYIRFKDCTFVNTIFKSAANFQFDHCHFDNVQFIDCNDVMSIDAQINQCDGNIHFNNCYIKVLTLTKCENIDCYFFHTDIEIYSAYDCIFGKLQLKHIIVKKQHFEKCVIKMMQYEYSSLNDIVYKTVTFNDSSYYMSSIQKMNIYHCNISNIRYTSYFEYMCVYMHCQIDHCQYVDSIISNCQYLYCDFGNTKYHNNYIKNVINNINNVVNNINNVINNIITNFHDDVDTTKKIYTIFENNNNDDMIDNKDTSENINDNKDTSEKIDDNKDITEKIDDNKNSEKNISKKDDFIKMKLIKLSYYSCNLSKVDFTTTICQQCRFYNSKLSEKKYHVNECIIDYSKKILHVVFDKKPSKLQRLIIYDRYFNDIATLSFNKNEGVYKNRQYHFYIPIDYATDRFGFYFHIDVLCYSNCIKQNIPCKKIFIGEIECINQEVNKFIRLSNDKKLLYRHQRSISI